MHIRHYFQRALMGFFDLYFMLVPRRRPARQALQDCKIISHRGEHDNRRVRENTLAAFAPVAAAGCWAMPTNSLHSSTSTWPPERWQYLTWACPARSSAATQIKMKNPN